MPIHPQRPRSSLLVARFVRAIVVVETRVLVPPVDRKDSTADVRPGIRLGWGLSNRRLPARRHQNREDPNASHAASFVTGTSRPRTCPWRTAPYCSCGCRCRPCRRRWCRGCCHRRCRCTRVDGAAVGRAVVGLVAVDSCGVAGLERSADDDCRAGDRHGRAEPVAGLRVRGLQVRGLTPDAVVAREEVGCAARGTTGCPSLRR